MISDIEHVIHKNVEGFLEQTAKEFDIPMPKLMENWKAHLGVGKQKSATTSSSASEHVVAEEASKKKPVKKTSLYQNFFVQKRVELVKENPDLQFGELSSQISQLWNKMTKDEQKQFATPVTEEPSSSATAQPRVQPRVAEVKTDGFDFESLNAKNMPELRKLCEEKGLKRTGNKLMLIHNLLGISTSVASTVSEVKKPVLVLPVVDEAEDVEVVVAKNMKRADIEEEIPGIYSEDEQDFDFEEGSNYSVNLEEDD